MTRTQHYLEAERLLNSVAREYVAREYDPPTSVAAVTLLIATAQVHATLALADSTVARTAGGEQSMFPPDTA